MSTELKEVKSSLTVFALPEAPETVTVKSKTLGSARGAGVEPTN